jgi:cell division protein FtsQ
MNMTMLAGKIKTLFHRTFSSSVIGKKQRGNNYLTGEMHGAALPGQNSHQNGLYRQRKNRLARFRQLLTAKRRTNHDSYQSVAGSGGRKKMMFRMAATAVVLCSLLLFALIGGWPIILKNIESLPFFRVSTVVFSGTDTISEEKLREAAGIILHRTSLLGLDCRQAEASLRTVPWVARAEVQKNWPSTVKISIVENVPVALLHAKNVSGTQLQYIDNKGVPFLQVKPGADLDFPVITGLTEIDDSRLREAALAEALVFLKNVNGNNPYLPAHSVSEIHLNRGGELVVYLVEYPFPIFFGASNTSNKYSRLVQVLKALYKKQNGRGTISQIEYIQMDYLDDKVLVAQSESG